MRVKLVARHGGFRKCDVERSFGSIGPDKVSDDALEVSQSSSVGGLGFNTIECFWYELLAYCLLSFSWGEG